MKISIFLCVVTCFVQLLLFMCSQLNAEEGLSAQDKNPAYSNSKNTENDMFLLHDATQRGLVNNVKGLLNKGTAPDLTNEKGNTALLIASKKGNFNIVKLLLDNNANTDIQNNEGNTALHMASARGSIKVVEMLLDKDASVDIKNKKGETALKIVFEAAFDKLGELLLDKGANTELSYKGITPLKWYHDAIKHGDTISQFNIGVMFDRGIFVKPNIAFAKKWYNKAAQQGFPYAQYNLGVLYGKGEKVNKYLAINWIYRAGLFLLRSGNRDMVERAAQLIKEIDPSSSFGNALVSKL